MTVAISVEEVSKSFGPTKALSEITFSVNQGESRALIGKNGAGKSTLVGILTGILAPDLGTVSIVSDRGETAKVGCVYQRSTLIPAATAAENLALARYPRGPLGLIRWSSVLRRATDLLDEWGCGDLAKTPVEQLDPLERKVVEICRVLSLGPQVLLLDEPTAGLDRMAAKLLFDRMRAAHDRGVTTVYVSHHMHEIFEVCDSVSVLRDGRLTMTAELAGMTVPDLVEAMVGESTDGAPAARERSAPPANLQPTLVMEGIVARPKVNHVDLVVHPGECVGLTGLDGAGHMQIAEIISGLRKPDAGKVLVKDKPLPFGDVRASMRAGVGFTPEDRHQGGCIPAMSVAENATLGIMKQLRNRLGLIRGRERDDYYERLAEAWSIKARDPSQPIEELSGGNQQKVVLARSVATNPVLLVLANPTAGVDVAAKQSIYLTIDELRRQGQGVLIVTSDDADLDVCDRVIVMVHGEVAGELLPPFSETVLAAAVQGAAMSVPVAIEPGETHPIQEMNR